MKFDCECRAGISGTMDEEDNATNGEANHSQAKKTKLSDDHNGPELSTSTMATTAVTVTDVAKEANTQPQLPSSSSGAVPVEQGDGYVAFVMLFYDDY